MGRRKRVRRRVWALLLAVTVTAVLLLVFTDTRLRPVVESYSAAQTKKEAALAADRAVTAALEQVEAASLLHIQRDGAGYIQSVETDMSRINRLKRLVTEEVVRRLTADDLTLHIPAGTLTGSDLLTGRGPRLPIRISRRVTAVTSLKGQFESAGINQTNHRLWLRVEVTAVCAISGFRQISVVCESEYLIAETVLVGKVPETLADWNFVE